VGLGLIEDNQCIIAVRLKSELGLNEGSHGAVQGQVRQLTTHRSLPQLAAVPKPKVSLLIRAGWDAGDKEKEEWDVVGRLREWRRATPHLASTPTGGC
jgi:hypothetical protein